MVRLTILMAESTGFWVGWIKFGRRRVHWDGQHCGKKNRLGDHNQEYCFGCPVDIQGRCRGHHWI